LLPVPPAAVNEIETTGSSTKSRRRVAVRNRKFSHQQQQSTTTTTVAVAVNNGDPTNEDDGDNNSDSEDYYASNDDDNDDVSSAKSKTKRKITKLRYSKQQIERWNGMFQRLVAYKKKHGSISVPNRYAEDPQLGAWVRTQRYLYKITEISIERMRRLDSIGFVWKILDFVPWMEVYQRLVVYKNKHKSTNVPNRYAEDPKLGNWVNNQRQFYHNKNLSIERINRLESIDFVWDVYDAQWMDMYGKLVAYKKQNKSTLVPQRYEEDPKLGQWVVYQRDNYKYGIARLSEETNQTSELDQFCLVNEEGFLKQTEINASERACFTVLVGELIRQILIVGV
jgi:hypothetical protein